MCRCIATFDKLLAPANARLVVTFNLHGQVFPVIAAERIENRRDGKRAPIVVPTYCPFCGVKYEKKGKTCKAQPVPDTATPTAKTGRASARSVQPTARRRATSARRNSSYKSFPPVAEPPQKR